MSFKLLGAALVSASMIAAPVAAQTSASKLSVVSSRAGAASGSSKLEGGSGTIIALALVAGIAAIGVLAAIESGDNNNDNPASN